MAQRPPYKRAYFSCFFRFCFSMPSFRFFFVFSLRFAVSFTSHSLSSSFALQCFYYVWQICFLLRLTLLFHHTHTYFFFLYFYFFILIHNFYHISCVCRHTYVYMCMCMCVCSQHHCTNAFLVQFYSLFTFVVSFLFLFLALCRVRFFLFLFFMFFFLRFYYLNFFMQSHTIRTAHKVLFIIFMWGIFIFDYMYICPRYLIGHFLRSHSLVVNNERNVDVE